MAAVLAAEGLTGSAGQGLRPRSGVGRVGRCAVTQDQEDKCFTVEGLARGAPVCSPRESRRAGDSQREWKEGGNKWIGPEIFKQKISILKL